MRNETHNSQNRLFGVGMSVGVTSKPRLTHVRWGFPLFSGPNGITIFALTRIIFIFVSCRQEPRL